MSYDADGFDVSWVLAMDLTLSLLSYPGANPVIVCNNKLSASPAFLLQNALIEPEHIPLWDISMRGICNWVSS